MNSTQQPRPTRGRHGPAHRDPVDLAPSVERAWADAFVVEQRLLGVPGTRIGDALVTVESHVVDSGQSAREAFGDPQDYARQLAEGVDTDDQAVTLRVVLSSVLGVVGLLLAVNGFSALVEGEAAQVTAGLVAAGVLLLAVLGGFLARATAVLRVLVDRLWVVALALVAFVGASVALLLLLPQVLLEVPAGVLLASGVVLLVVDSVLSWTGSGTDDLVLAPGEEAPRSRWSRASATFLMPAAALLMMAVTWAVHALA